MRALDKLYIDGVWVTPKGNSTFDVLNPANGEVALQMACADERDVDNAVRAARAAFPKWSQTPASERAVFLHAVADEMDKRLDELNAAHTLCMGIPLHQAADFQVLAPIDGVRLYADMCAKADEEITDNDILILREPIGVCALINPWNYPLMQMIGKVAPALAAGCTVVAKPAEQTPLLDVIMAEIFDKVGLPAGVFNLIMGQGSEIGGPLCSHSDVDMVSFTGSTAAGIKVAQAAAPSVKRVCQELGGKSALIITDDAPFEDAITYGVDHVMLMGGQTCDAFSRMLVPASRYAEAVALAKAATERHQVGDPLNPKTDIGPLASFTHRDRVLNYIKIGIDEGARLVTGGAHAPEGLAGGAYVTPTVFADVTNDMRIAREEIFGPVLCIMAYDDIEEAIAIANDSEYGLSSGVYTKDKAAAMPIARRLQAGQCVIQGGGFSIHAPFGGYKTSGNGREWGTHGLEEYLETKAIISG